jgi:DNA mismatch repair protein MutL
VSVAGLAGEAAFPPPPPGFVDAVSAIRVLPPSVAAKIAAGETIERPASVVKELAENGLDAGATVVRIDVRGGGLGSIRVGDDGRGMRAADLWLACQRHATSKFPADGLGAVASLGFRGEALPSIAAVAELTIASAADERGLGWLLCLREGRVLRDEPAPRPRGTTVTVRRLFERLPARLAALRPQTELAQLVQVVRRLAVAAPRVRFELRIDDRLALQTGGSGDLAAALAEVYALPPEAILLPLGPLNLPLPHDGGAGTIRVRGAAAGPETTRAGRGAVHLVVNGRAAGSRHLLAALEAAWRPLLPRGRHPVIALDLRLPAERVDVNVHPAKEEVRLRDERAVGAALAELAREAFGRRPLTLAMKPLTGAAVLAREAALAEEAPGYDGEGPIVTPGLPPLRLVGQLQDRLLLLEGEAGLFLVDQHRAHERILYERLRAAHGASPGAGSSAGAGASPLLNPVNSPGVGSEFSPGAGPGVRAGVDASAGPAPLTDPLLLELRPHQAARFAARLGDLAALGFGVEAFGGRTFLLREAPRLPGVLGDDPDAPLGGLGETDALLAALLELADDPAGEGEAWRDRLLVSLSCRSAVRRGRSLSRPQMRALVDGLGRTAAPAVCPHGSPLLMHVGGEVFTRQFGW